MNNEIPDEEFMKPVESMSRETLIQMVRYYEAQDGLLTRAQEEAKSLREELAEVRRPLDDQMARLNRRVIWLNKELEGARASAEPAQPVALSTLTEICQRCKGSGIVDDGEINCFEDGTPFENGPVKCVKDCPACAASTPSAVATPSPEALVEQYLADLISRSPDPLRELGDYLGRVLDEDEFPTAERYVLAAMKASLATPPQPVAAEVAIAPKLLLERAAEMCEWYAEFIRDNVMSQDIERHPYLPELEGVAVDLRALAGTGSDESAKENGNGL